MKFMKTISLAGAGALTGLAMTTSVVCADGVAHVVPPSGTVTPKDSADLVKRVQELETKVQAIRTKRAPGRNNFALTLGRETNSEDDALAEIGDELSRLKQDVSTGGAAKSTTSNGNSTTSISNIPSGDDDYLDDSLRWHVPVHVYQMVSTGDVDLSKAFCLPAGTSVLGMSSTFTSGSQTDSSGSGTPAANYLPVKLGGRLFLKGTPTATASGQDMSKGAEMCAPTNPATQLPLTDTQEFFVAANDLKDADREGLDFGTLVVPFKFQLSDKKAVTGSATLGGYVGYRLPWDIAGMRVRPVLFAGLSEVPTGSQTVAGLSYGGGLIGTIKDRFNFGLLVGADHVDSVQQYQYQDKPWISLVLGISLTK